MDSRLVDVLEEAFGDELALVPELGSLQSAVSATLRTPGLGLLKRVLRRRPSAGLGNEKAGCGNGRRRGSWRTWPKRFRDTVAASGRP